MSLEQLPIDDLLDLADSSIARMRQEEELEKLMGLSSLQQIVNVIVDRQRSTQSFLVPPPPSDLAKVIADAMWDENSNRVGGPRTAAAAVEQYLANKEQQ